MASMVFDQSPCLTNSTWSARISFSPGSFSAFLFRSAAMLEARYSRSAGADGRRWLYTVLTSTTRTVVFVACTSSSFGLRSAMRLFLGVVDPYERLDRFDDALSIPDEIPSISPDERP